jgi:hypothetical protein
MYINTFRILIKKKKKKKSHIYNWFFLKKLIINCINFFGKLHFTPLNYPPIFTFISKVLNVTLNLPQTFKLWQFNHFDLFFFLKMPPSHNTHTHTYIYIKKYVGVANHPLWDGSATPTYFFFFFFFFLVFFLFFFYFFQKN